VVATATSSGAVPGHTQAGRSGQAGSVLLDDVCPGEVRVGGACDLVRLLVGLKDGSWCGRVFALL
jgi:hypothetical protein